MREALKAPPKPEPKPDPKPEVIQEHITHEIAAFESALREVPTVKPAERAPRPPAPTARPAPPVLEHAQPLDESFFHEFEEFLTREGLESEGVLDKDILYRMKEFHRHRQEGKEFYIYSKDIQAAIQHKLGELKSLEQDWFTRRTQIDELERELHLVENEIQSRTSDLRSLIAQANLKSRLEHKVPEGYEFALSDGRKLLSLLDLKVALHKMPDTVFTHHVTSGKNDFSTWVRFAMNDPQLAERMDPIRDRQQLEVFLGKLGN